MRYCAKCNQTFDDSTGFCTSCGAQTTFIQQQPQTPQYAGAYAPAKKRVKKAAIIIPIVSVVVIGAALLVLFLTGVLGKDPLIGTWLQNGNDKLPMTFSDNGTVVYKYADNGVKEVSCNWKKSGDKLTFVYDNGEEETHTVLSLTDTALVLKYNNFGGGITTWIKLKKKN